MDCLRPCRTVADRCRSRIDRRSHDPWSAAAVYGNAAGGVIDIRTADRIETGHRFDLRFQGGSDDFWRVGLRGGMEGETWRGHISAWQLEHDGYREQSETRKRMAHARLHHEVSAGRSLTTLLTVLDQPFGKDPGGLTRAEVETDRRMAAPNALALDAGQQVRQQRIGWVLRDEILLPGEIDAYVFYTRREFEQQLPFAGSSLIGFDRDFYGAGIDYTDQAQLVGRSLHYTFGVEVHRQRDDRQRFLVDGGGNRGAQIQDALESATVGGVHGRMDFALTNRLDLTLGARLDLIRFAIDDHLTADGLASGSRDYDELSFMAGLGWQWRAAHRFYANVGSAFETPTFTEFRDPNAPDQGFDPALEPQQALNVEAGIKGLFAPRLRYDPRCRFVPATRSCRSPPIPTMPMPRRPGGSNGRYRFDEAWSLSGAYEPFPSIVSPLPKVCPARRGLPGLPTSPVWRTGLA